MYWAPDEDDTPGGDSWPPGAFADEIEGWIDRRAVQRAATALRAVVQRFAAPVHSPAWRLSSGGARPPAIRHRAGG